MNTVDIIKLVFILLAISVVVYLIYKFNLKNKGAWKYKTNKTPQTKKVSLTKVQKKMLVILNIIFLILSYLNSRALVEISTLEGAGSAQGEFIFYFLITPVSIVLAIISSAIGFFTSPVVRLCKSL